MDDRKPLDAPADRGSMLIAIAIFGGALVLSWGMGRGEPRYQLAGTGDTIVRMDNDSGEMIACNQQRCAVVEMPVSRQTLGPVTIERRSEAEKALPSDNEAAG